MKPVDKIKTFAATKNLIPAIPFTDIMPHLRVAATELVNRIQRDYKENQRLPSILTVHYYAKVQTQHDINRTNKFTNRGQGELKGGVQFIIIVRGQQ